jgi:hypothetical protein
MKIYWTIKRNDVRVFTSSTLDTGLGDANLRTLVGIVLDALRANGDGRYRLYRVTVNG